MWAVSEKNFFVTGLEFIAWLSTAASHAHMLWFVFKNHCKKKKKNTVGCGMCKWIYAKHLIFACLKHSFIQHQPGEQADHGLQRLYHPGWGRQQPWPLRGVNRTQACGGQWTGHSPVQLLLLPLHALPCLTLYYDDPHQLVQVSNPQHNWRKPELF